MVPVTPYYKEQHMEAIVHACLSWSSTHSDYSVDDIAIAIVKFMTPVEITAE